MLDDRARSLAGTELFAHSRRQRKKVEMLFAHRPPSFPPMAKEIKEAPRETGLAGLRAGSRASMPDGHCRWPSFRVGGGETLHHELPISTVRVSDKKSVRVRRCRLGGIWTTGLRWVHLPRVAPNAQFADLANKWQKFAIDSEACLKPVDEQSHPKEGRSDPKKVSRHRALRGRHINKKPMRAAKHQGGSGGRQRKSKPRRFREKGRQPFGVTPSRHLLARILAPWRIEHPLNFGKTRIFSAARTTICSHKPQQA